MRRSALAFVFAAAGACYSTTAVDPARPPARFDDPVIVQTRGGAEYRFHRAVVAGDSLVGPTNRTHRTAIAIADIQRMETSRFDGGKTAALIGGSVAAAAFFVLLVVNAIFSDSNY